MRQDGVCQHDILTLFLIINGSVRTSSRSERDSVLTPTPLAGDKKEGIGTESSRYG